jgi:sigma-B regulation protein RsbU (phosphoserine phosphatase)
MILPIGEKSATKEVINNKKTVVIQNSQQDERTKPMADVSKQRGTKSIMIVPLMTRGTAIGTIGMPARDPDYHFNANEVSLAETIAIQIATAIDNAQLYAKTESALDLAEGDLEIGRQIQSGFFPESIPKIPGWEITAHFEASRQVAGDFYDFFQFENSKYLTLVIADVCDKGVGAALFMVLFRSLLRAFSRVDINNGDVSDHLKNIIANTNNYISEIHGSSNMFATMFLGILDPDSRILYYVNGGHEPPAMLNKSGRIVHRLMPTGPAVGIFPGMAYEVGQVEFEPGDFLVGYTDGTTDARNTEGDVFSEARLLNYIQAPWTSLFSMVYELKNELHKYSGSQQQFDDITLISIRRALTPDHIQHAICREASMDYLSEMCDFVDASTLQSDLTHDDAFAFRLAAEEICKNIIQHGFNGKKPGQMSLSFEKGPGNARLIIRDDGRYFPPDQAQAPDLEADWEERKIGGLGIHLVKQLMDEISYQKMDGGGNQMTLEKKINNIMKKEPEQWNFIPNK